jgi:hypothetical protein
VRSRRLQTALGLLWLLDGALQLQPFMLGTGFARRIVDPAGDGQPQLVAAPVHWAAHVIAAHPVAWDVPFAVVQLLLGLGLLVRRTGRLALLASIPWALGVWVIGEGMSGIASGHASLTTGAPGSAVLYAVLAVAALQGPEGRSRFLCAAWAVIWIGGAVSQSRDGSVGGAALLAAETLAGLGILTRRTRRVAASLGFALALWMWVVGQDLGQLTSGEATDPNTGPLLALMAVVLFMDAREAVARTDRQTARAAAGTRRLPVPRSSS